jgi:hypothetical protein
VTGSDDLSEFFVTDTVYERRTVSPEQPPEQPNARILYDYWKKRRAMRAFPAWKDIELIDLWRIAPCLIVKDVIDGGKDFLNRYWGTQITMRAGFDATGRLHTSIYQSQPLGPQMDAYLEVVSKGLANTVHRASSFISGREFIYYHSLNLPLGENDNKVSHIISVVDYVDS